MTFIITIDHLKKISGFNYSHLPSLVEWMNNTCPKFEIDTPQEYTHFIAQGCHETDHFKTLKEYASGKEYEDRHDLGNTEIGDGVKFKGRGIFQTTGRANYHQLGIKYGDEDIFTQHPELLETSEYAVWSACIFWQTRGLNDIANHSDNDKLKKKYKGQVIEVSPVEYISLVINGGYNGMEERKKYYEISKKVLI